MRGGGGGGGLGETPVEQFAVIIISFLHKINCSFPFIHIALYSDNLKIIIRAKYK